MNQKITKSKQIWNYLKSTESVGTHPVDPIQDNAPDWLWWKNQRTTHRKPLRNDGWGEVADCVVDSAQVQGAHERVLLFVFLLHDPSEFVFHMNIYAVLILLRGFKSLKKNDGEDLDLIQSRLILSLQLSFILLPSDNSRVCNSLWGALPEPFWTALPLFLERHFFSGEQLALICNMVWFSLTVHITFQRQYAVFHLNNMQVRRVRKGLDRPWRVRQRHRHQSWQCHTRARSGLHGWTVPDSFDEGNGHEA